MIYDVIGVSVAEWFREMILELDENFQRLDIVVSAEAPLFAD